MPLPPTSTLFPYTTLFRSLRIALGLVVGTLSAVSVFAQAAPAQPPAQQAQAAPTKREFANDAGMVLNRSEEHTSELQSRRDLVCRLLLEKKNADNRK